MIHPATRSSPGARSSSLIRTLLLLSVGASFTARASAQSWPVRMGGSNGDSGADIATDGAGAVFVTGFFETGFTVGDDTEPLFASEGSRDVFVLKLDRFGQLEPVWGARRVGGIGNDEGRSVAVDRAGNVYVTGNFTGTVRFGRTSEGVDINLTASGSPDAFIAKWDAFGAFAWARKVHARQAFGNSVAVDASGSVYVAGRTFGPAAGFVTKFNTTGVQLWTSELSLSNGSIVEGTAVAVHTDTGTVFLYGRADGGVGPQLQFSPAFAGRAWPYAENMFVARLRSDTGGWLALVEPVSGPVNIDVLNLSPRGMVIDRSGNVFLTAFFEGAVRFEGSEIQRDGDGADTFVMALTPSLAARWLRVIAAPDGDLRAAVAVDASGSTYLGGHFSPGTAFFRDAFTRIGQLGAFVARLDSNGNWEWAEFPGVPASSGGVRGSLAVSIQDHVFLNTSFSETVSFGGREVSAAGLANIDGLVGPFNICGQANAPESWVVGAEVPRPSCAAAQEPQIELFGDQQGLDPDDHFFWCPFVSRLYATRPASALIRWRVPGTTLKALTFGTSSWPTQSSIHVAGAPAELERPDTEDAFRFSALNTSESNATVEETERVFNAMGTGHSALRFATGGAPDVPCTSSVPVFEVVRTVMWDDAAFRTEVAWEIGTAVEDADHHDPSGKNGYVLFEKARYDGEGADRAHDRATRTGSIIPVNKVNSPSEDKLVVVWYSTEPEGVQSPVGVAWPDKPVQYNADWPLEPARLVIASQQGSRGLDPAIFPDARVYHQPSLARPGFNPNEEHAVLVAANDGSSLNALFALRSDLEQPETSEPYALLKHRDPDTGNWRFKVYRVLDQGFTDEWSRLDRAGGAGGDAARAVAVDDDGNFFVTGAFSGRGDFGGITLESRASASAFVAKIAPSGRWEWARAVGATGFNEGNGIAVDASGRVVVTGSFAGTASFGSTLAGQEVSLTASGAGDVFVAQWDSASGNIVWAAKASGSIFAPDHGASVDLDGSGGVCVTGFVAGSPATFGTVVAASTSVLNFFVAKLTADGVWQWALLSQAQAGRRLDDAVGLTVAADASGNVFAAGYYSGELSFAGADLDSSGGSYDVFVTKLDSAGTPLWARSAGGPNYDEGSALAVDSSGAVYLTGSYGGLTATFGIITLSSAAFEEHGFIAKLSPNGTVLFAKNIATGSGRSTGIAAAPNGGIVVTGYFEGAATFGAGEADETAFAPGGGRNLFVARLRPADGSLIHAARGGGPRADFFPGFVSGLFTKGPAVAVRPTGPSEDVYLAGQFSGTAFFGDNDQALSASSNDPANPDVFVARLDSKFHTFDYAGTAGSLIQPPYPLPLFLPACAESEGVLGPYWEDYKGGLWARAAGMNPADTDEVVVRFFYRLQPGFHDARGRALGACVPWLDLLPRQDFPQGRPDVPFEITYTIRWPPSVPSLRAGETLTKQKRGLPNIVDQASARVVFDRSVVAGGAPLVKLYDPLSERRERLDSLPGEADFSTLPFHLRSRLSYDGISRLLGFKGVLDTTSSVGEPLLLPNVMSKADWLAVRGLSTDAAFRGAVDRLYVKTRNPAGIQLSQSMVPNPYFPASRYPTYSGPDYDLDQWGGDAVANPAVDPSSPLLGLEINAAEEAVPAQHRGVPMALTAGAAGATGFVTVIFNDDPSLDPLPVSASVLRVACPVYAGEVKVIESDNVFDEKLTLRHSGDFGGDPDKFEFEWWYMPDTTGTPPVTLPPGNGWLRFGGDPLGQVSITIGGPGLLTISDNWFFVRYCFEGKFDFCASSEPLTQGNPCVKWSGLGGAPGATTTPRPQLAEGWIKRVVRGLNPFDSRIQDFHRAATNTFASALIQAGTRYEGDIAFSGEPEALNSVGLIEAYETVLRRGLQLSVDAGFNFGPANTALLLASGRIADLYMLLGNEAFADAADPIIGFDTSGEFGSLAPSVFAFQNQLSSLLEEELVLLRGRDDLAAPVGARPVYNRLFWNFTSGEGQVAYVQAYNIADQNVDGFVDERDARILFPQGHGDSWGHYLTALTSYYRLLRHPNYTWEPRAESVLVAGTPVLVDYLDERKFARAAAAKAKTGAEVVNLTYRERYVEDPAGQWQGYKDTDRERAWGLSEWSRRAGQGAYFDWLVANAILPAVDPDPERTGIRKIDRTTVEEIAEIVSEARAIQNEVDKADAGLNPLGLEKDVVPFDIDPNFLEVGSGIQGKTHFEQVYDRTLHAMAGAITVFDHANQLTEMLRRTQDTVNEFIANTDAQERDFRNRLIEIFGYPYADDIGPPGAYRSGYDGPDLVHYMYVDATALTGGSPGPVQEFSFTYKDPEGETLTGSLTDVQYNIETSGYGFTSNALGFSGQRRAPGELQMAISEVILADAAHRRAAREYSNLLRAIEDQTALIAALHALNAEQIEAVNDAQNTRIAMSALIIAAKAAELGFKRAAETVDTTTEAIIAGIPTVIGIASDAFSAARGVIKSVASPFEIFFRISGDVAEGAQTGFEEAKEIADAAAEIRIVAAAATYEATQAVRELEALVREEPLLRLDVYTAEEARRQAVGNYLAKLAEGERLIQELVTFRKLAAAETAEHRYRDMAFRLFRNDALQKYRAQFDLAARYVYLAAKAYDYETNFLGSERGSGERFLTDIVRQRSLGQILDEVPIAGTPGLADPLGRMRQNYLVLEGQFGFNNPQIETGYFSLRSELFRIRPQPAPEEAPDPDADEEWRLELMRHRVADLWDVPEFRRYCRPFAPEFSASGGRIAQPGIVIRFPTTITFGLNFFGHELGGGDGSYDPTNFTTKARSVGVWFTGYNATGLARTPRVYLVPAGMDVLRSPSGNTLATREFRIVDQKIPVPFPVGTADLQDPNWIPIAGSLSEDFAGIRRYSSFRAFHDSGFDEEELVFDTRVVGRSVWNTSWVLIIPGGTFLFDAEEGLDTFIEGVNRDGEGVSDIRIFFETFAFSGN